MHTWGYSSQSPLPRRSLPLAYNLTILNIFGCLLNKKLTYIFKYIVSSETCIFANS